MSARSPGESGRPGTQVACVNPADIGGGRAVLHPYFPPVDFAPDDVDTPWVAYPDTYRARCRHADGATWLEVTPVHGSDDPRTWLRTSLGAMWGYHAFDLNVALGDLVADVRAVVTEEG